MGDLDALARELVGAGCPWLERMRTKLEGWTVLQVEPDAIYFHVGGSRGQSPMWVPRGEMSPECVPDLADWPTVGALLGELSKRGRPLLCRFPTGVWVCDLIGHDLPPSARDVRASTPGEAVGRALLAVLRGGS